MVNGRLPTDAAQQSGRRLNGIPANALLNILAKCGSLGIRKQTAADSRRISTKSIDR